MKTTVAGWLVVLAGLVLTGSALAHHSIANFDTTKAIRAKGKVLRFHKINPHSFLYVEETTADGKSQRWAAEGHGVLQLDRRGIAADFLKPGDTVEICGYAHKDNVVWQIANVGPDARAVSLSGRLLETEVIVMPDGREQVWSDYGVHLCFAPGARDGRSK